MTSRPQRWAAVPAVAMGATGLALLVFSPQDDALTPLNWVWPPVDAGAGGLDVRPDAPRPARPRPLAAHPGPRRPGRRVRRRHLREHRRRSATRTPTPPPGRPTRSATTACTSTAAGTAAPPSCSSTAWARSPPPGPGSPTRSAPPPGSAPTTAPDRAGATTSTTPRTAIDRRPGPAHPAGRGRRDGPYVLVGHSIGGPYAMTYAAPYPEQVAGMVLLDSSSPEQLTAIPRLRRPVRRHAARPGAAAHAGTASACGRVARSRLPPARTGGRPGRGHDLDPARRPQRARRDVDGPATSSSRRRRSPRCGDRPLAVLTASENLDDDGLGRAPRTSSRPLHQPASTATVESTHAGLLEDAARRRRVGARHHRGHLRGPHRLRPGHAMTTPLAPATHHHHPPEEFRCPTHPPTTHAASHAEERARTQEVLGPARRRPGRPDPGRPRHLGRQHRPADHRTRAATSTAASCSGWSPPT